MITSPDSQDFKILAIDDDPMFLRSLERILIHTPYTASTMTNPVQALRAMETERFDLVLLDLQMPGRDGLSVLEEFLLADPEVLVVMLTGHGSVQQAVKAIKLGASDFLEKPCSPAALCQVLANYHAIVRQRRTQAAGATHTFSYPALVGESPPIQEIKAMILRVAASEAPVLLLGESGTGKELAARAVHHHSPRHDCPFCAIDCAAINESVLESELFGYEKGAFTGADQSTQGLIRSADKGTLFLDEIGELPLKMQAKLLRTLQERVVRPVGSTKTYPVDIRIIAATNRNLEQEIAKGRFRSDLYFRISAIPIMLPPLRERTSDISLLVDGLLTRLDPERPKRVSAAALRLLESYTWPGNVRELENVLRRALALSEQETLLPVDLPATLVFNGGTQVEVSPENDSLLAYEQIALQNALQKTKHNKRQAAAMLGISEATLYRKLKLFNLS